MHTHVTAQQEGQALAVSFRALLEQGIQPRPSSDRLQTSFTAAPWTLHEIGVHFHQLMVLQEVMDGFVVAGDHSDPPPAFNDILAAYSSGPDLGTRAQRCYHAALALAPAQAETLYNLAVLDGRNLRWDDALAGFEHVATLGPSAGSPPHAHLRANAHWNIGLIQDRLGHTKQAEAAFTRALELLDNFGVAHRYFADWLLNQGRHKEAIEHYHRIMPYSHRYAPEFIAPGLTYDRRGPRNIMGWPLDPFTVTSISRGGNGGEIVYFALLYFELSPGANPSELPGQVAVLRPLGFWGQLFQRCWPHRASAPHPFTCMLTPTLPTQ